jgi:hypothetical protein
MPMRVRRDDEPLCETAAAARERTEGIHIDKRLIPPIPSAKRGGAIAIEILLRHSVGGLCWSEATLVGNVIDVGA